MDATKIEAVRTGVDGTKCKFTTAFSTALATARHRSQANKLGTEHVFAMPRKVIFFWTIIDAGWLKNFLAVKIRQPF